MRQTNPAPIPPAERLAARICKSTNAKGGTDAGPAIAEARRRANAAEVEAAIGVAVERGWLRRDGATYTIMPGGAELGGSRSGKRTRRVLPF